MNPIMVSQRHLLLWELRARHVLVCVCERVCVSPCVCVCVCVCYIVASPCGGFVPLFYWSRRQTRERERAKRLKCCLQGNRGKHSALHCMGYGGGFLANIWFFILRVLLNALAILTFLPGHGEVQVCATTSSTFSNFLSFFSAFTRDICWASL